MSFQDSAVIFFIALLLFGPKKLPELARQIGKLMGEFRRASNDFRMQMEDELRVSEQAERQKQIAAIAAATLPASAPEAASSDIVTSPANLIAGVTPPAADEVEPHPHVVLSLSASERLLPVDNSEEHAAGTETPTPPDRYRRDPNGEGTNGIALPIATAGDLTMRPPASGVPVGRSKPGVADVFEAVPPASVPADNHSDHETAQHG